MNANSIEGIFGEMREAEVPKVRFSRERNR